MKKKKKKSDYPWLPEHQDTGFYDGHTHTKNFHKTGVTGPQPRESLTRVLHNSAVNQSWQASRPGARTRGERLYLFAVYINGGAYGVYDRPYSFRCFLRRNFVFYVFGKPIFCSILQERLLFCAHRSLRNDEPDLKSEILSHVAQRQVRKTRVLSSKYDFKLVPIVTGSISSRRRD